MPDAGVTFVVAEGAVEIAEEAGANDEIVLDDDDALEAVDDLRNTVRDVGSQTEVAITLCDVDGAEARSKMNNSGNFRDNVVFCRSARAINKGIKICFRGQWILGKRGKCLPGMLRTCVSKEGNWRQTTGRIMRALRSGNWFQRIDSSKRVRDR